MPSLFSHLVLSPEDIGIEQYTVKEIAEMMKPVEKDDSTLYEFARTVNLYLDNDNCQSNTDE